MKDSSNARTVRRIFKDETKCYGYEIYENNMDNLKRVKTFLVLNDGFDTTLPLNDLGPLTDETLEELKNEGYIEVGKLKLTKK